MQRRNVIWRGFLKLLLKLVQLAGTSFFHGQFENVLERLFEIHCQLGIRRRFFLAAREERQLEGLPNS